MWSSPLWRHADFLRFWSAASASLIGDAVTRLALPLIAITILDATALEVGILGAAQLGPFLLVAAAPARWAVVATAAMVLIDSFGIGLHRLALHRLVGRPSHHTARTRTRTRTGTG